MRTNWFLRAEAHAATDTWAHIRELAGGALHQPRRCVNSSPVGLSSVAVTTWLRTTAIQEGGDFRLDGGVKVDSLPRTLATAVTA